MAVKCFEQYERMHHSNFGDRYRLFLDYLDATDDALRKHVGIFRMSLMQVMTSFNPRSHTGSDLKGVNASRQVKRFNPRSHTGSDEEYPSMLDYSLVSIHAPTRGATVYYILLYITTGCNTVFAKELNAVTNP